MDPKKKRVAGEAFDKRFQLRKDYIPKTLQDAMLFVNDTMEMAYSSAQQVFGDNIPPDVVIAIYDRMVQEWRTADPKLTASDAVRP